MDLATVFSGLLRFLGARPASGEDEVWFGFEGLDPGWALLIAGIAALCIARAYLKGPGGLGAPRRCLLGSLRMAAVLLLLLILMYPVIRVTEETMVRGTLLVLLDSSESMELSDARTREIDRQRVEAAFGSLDEAAANPEPSRREMLEAVAANRDLDLFGRLSEKVNLIVAPFGRRAGEPQSIVPDGERITPGKAGSFFESMPSGEPATAVSDSLKGAFDQTTGKPLSAVFLISDGANNAGAPLTTAAEVARSRGVPLFVYATGVEAQKDLAVLSFSGPAMAFAGEDAVLNVRLRTTGIAGVQAEVRLKQGEETVDTQVLEIDGDGESELAFNYSSPEVGDWELGVEVDPIEGEATLENNFAAMNLRVLDRRVKVLLIEQEPRWDFRYLLDTLKRDRRVEVSAVMLDGDSTLGTEEDSRFLKGLPSPEELLEYVIVVIGDVDPERLSEQHLEALDSLARQTGGGLVFHAGPNFNPSRYGGTVLGDLLPVSLPRTLANSEERYPEPVPLLLTPEGRRSGLLRLDPNPTVSEGLWRGFPGVRWTARTGPAKPAAEVLLVDPTDARKVEGKAQPVLVRMPVGRGQVFYFGFDETWRWRSRVGERDYLKIWGQVFLKLGVERLTGASDLVQLNTVRSSYALGETVLISGRIFSEDFEALDLPEVSGTLHIDPADPDTETIRQNVTLKARPERPGDYELEVLAGTPGRYRVSTELDPEAEVVFDVSASNLELRDPSLNLSGLEQLVREDGELFREEDLSRLPDRVVDVLPSVREVRKYEPGFHPLVYFLLLFLATAEWMMRRIWKLK